jgi:hypothetical protein
LTPRDQHKTLPTHSLPLTGTYPHIVKRLPNIGGADNMGPGSTQHGESFLLKKGGMVGASEFIGAGLCHACGVPYCTPAVVTLDHFGTTQHLFGSRIELGLKKFDRTNVAQWMQIIASCMNPSIFSAIFAIDLALGNDDRHWNNWLVQDVDDGTGGASYCVRAMDFSRSWPIINPAQLPLRHQSYNTWEATKYWQMFGITFDQQVFFDTCVRMCGLSSGWLRDHVLNQLHGIFLTQTQIDQLCHWWDSCWKAQVIEVIHSLENGVRP